MMSKRRIALLIAGMLVGAQVGVASMVGPDAASDQQPETPLQAEASEPTAAPGADSQAGPEQTAAAEPVAPDHGQVAPAKPLTLADAILPPLQSDTFPPSTDERPLHPAVAAYLDRKAAHTLLADAGAAESPFPDATEPGERISPIQIAYFDRLEAERLAIAEVRIAEQRLQAEREVAARPVETAELRAVEMAAQSSAEQPAANPAQ